MDTFPRKQVHLDFHTSPDIPGIGSRFSKEQFQAALKAGNLDSITIFAKCHHGLCYYPTEVGTKHPGLDFDLTGAMLEAAHEIGVRAPIYITAGWSELDAEQHPEWIAVDQNGEKILSEGMQKSLRRGMHRQREEVAWSNLCLNDGDYCAHIYAITEEVCKRYRVVDGLFFDICVMEDRCYCETCLLGMAELGLDPKKEEDARAYYILKRKAFMKKCGEILKKYHPDATIFFNSGGADQYRPAYHAHQSHFEMEDLPTVWGGYDKLPVRAKYFSKSGKPYLGMTGKFHLIWGEFGGFKSKEALKYEVCSMALYGAGCSIGDHVHPDGEMELKTYRNMGYAYRYLDQIAPYCYGGVSTARVGICLSPDPNENEGLSNILLENQIDYDVVYENDYFAYDTVVFPSGIVLDEPALEKLQQYLSGGGKVLFMGDSLLEHGSFQIDCGAEYVGKPEFDCDYLIPAMEAGEQVPDAPILCCAPGQRIRLTDGQALAEIMVPYFSRTNAHYCGHRNTPYNKQAEKLPGIVRKGNVVYLAHSMGKMYYEYGSIYHRNYLKLALDQLYSGGAFSAEGLGMTGRATMIQQPEQHRYCLNMVSAGPLRRGCAEIIGEVGVVHDIRITLRVPEQICRAWLPVTGEELPVRVMDGCQVVCIPKLECHTSLVLEYGET